MPYFNNRSTRKVSTPGADPSYTRTVQVAGLPTDILIKRCRRKTMALHVYPGKVVELRVPLKCPWREIDDFLDSRLGWIEDAQHELANRPVPAPPEYTEDSLHRFMGVKYPLRLEYGTRSRVDLEFGMLKVKCRMPGNQATVAGHIDSWYRRQAMDRFPDRISECLQKFPEPRPHRNLIVRKMKARWGSCAHNGDICLNSLLVKFPETAIDFVITHELCHLHHFSHSKGFYSLLESLMPDWKEREQLLVG